MNIEKAKIEDLDIINSYLEDMNMIKLNQNSFHFQFRKTNVIRLEKEVIAFICYLIVAEEVELEAIYVKPSFQRQGYANKLIEFMINDSKLLNCKKIFLEVRENNINAIHLYQKNGFEMIGRRNKYYGAIDGLVMEKELRCNDE